MTSEKQFQSYFMKNMPHGYRTSLISGGGFPDVLAIQGERHALIELKLLEVGPSGNKKVATVFKPTQRPWYAEYLHKGGRRLFVVFKLNEGYGVLHVDTDFIRDFDTVTYKDLWKYRYAEYKVLGELINEYFSEVV